MTCSRLRHGAPVISDVPLDSFLVCKSCDRLCKIELDCFEIDYKAKQEKVWH